MKNFFKLFAFLVLPVLLFNSCKDDPIVPTQTEFEILKTYLADNNLDLPAVTNGYTKAGSSINVNMTDYSVPDYYVIDLRSQTEFDAGHIKDAHIATLANVLDVAAQAGGKKILVTCYSGQTSGRAVAALRLLKYEAYSLKWGMSCWHDDFASKWNSGAADVTSPNWVTTGAPATPVTFSEPTLTTGKTDGAEILQARVTTMLAKSPWSASKTDVLANPGNYFIVNKWPQTSWDAYGHITGAYRIDEDLVLDKLTNLNPDPVKPVVVYCYTGQTSSITCGWLDVLGYNSLSLSNGTNGIIHTVMMNGTVDGCPAKSWKGTGSGSEMNYGYYDSTGTYHAPK